jgi:hypothetical protein
MRREAARREAQDEPAHASAEIRSAPPAPSITRRADGRQLEMLEAEAR